MKRDLRKIQFSRRAKIGIRYLNSETARGKLRDLETRPLRITGLPWIRRPPTGDGSMKTALLELLPAATGAGIVPPDLAAWDVRSTIV